MVQKEEQYHYIYKCLADYVSAQESEYVEYESEFWKIKLIKATVKIVCKDSWNFWATEKIVWAKY